jgi:hypothetical protein
MKKIILAIATMLICLNIFAQEAKPCLFIGRYDKVKKGVCSDRTWVHEGVKDIQEYQQKRKQFLEEHKADNCATEFISSKESVIVYEYQKRIGGWNCSPVVISLKKGPTIEDCNEQLAKQLAKYPKDFTTQPNTIFTWQGKGLTGSEYIKDYGGLKGRFISGNTATKDIIVAQLTNQTKDKLAIISLKINDGEMITEYVNPGAVLTQKYNGRKLEIQVKYQEFDAPRPSFKPLDFIKGKVRETIINEKGKLKSTSTNIGARG